MNHEAKPRAPIKQTNPEEPTPMGNKKAKPTPPITQTNPEEPTPMGNNKAELTPPITQTNPEEPTPMGNNKAEPTPPKKQTYPEEPTPLVDNPKKAEPTPPSKQMNPVGTTPLADNVAKTKYSPPNKQMHPKEPRPRTDSSKQSEPKASDEHPLKQWLHMPVQPMPGVGEEAPRIDEPPHKDSKVQTKNDKEQTNGFTSEEAQQYAYLCKKLSQVIRPIEAVQQAMHEDNTQWPWEKDSYEGQAKIFTKLHADKWAWATSLGEVTEQMIIKHVIGKIPGELRAMTKSAMQSMTKGNEETSILYPGANLDMLYDVINQAAATLDMMYAKRLAGVGQKFKYYAVAKPGKWGI